MLTTSCGRSLRHSLNRSKLLEFEVGDLNAFKLGLITSILNRISVNPGCHQPLI